MLVMVVTGYRLSWSCMRLVVLAYVSNGSFISKAADPCRSMPGQRECGTEAKPAAGAPNRGSDARRRFLPGKREKDTSQLSSCAVLSG